MNKKDSGEQDASESFFDTKICNIRLTVIENFAKLMEML